LIANNLRVNTRVNIFGTVSTSLIPKDLRVNTLLFFDRMHLITTAMEETRLLTCISAARSFGVLVRIERRSMAASDWSENEARNAKEPSQIPLKRGVV
jgi:hypothetical protein